METITRPNGKPYRPRKVTAHAVVDENEALAGVMVIGTHDIARATALAVRYAQWQLDAGYTAADPLPGWWRDGFEYGERRWLTDEEHGSAGVWFRDIVETETTPVDVSQTVDANRYNH